MTPVLEVRNLVKEFAGRGRGAAAVRAVDDVSLRIAAGEVYALVGESGSGKTTIGRCVLGLTPPDDGAVIVEGQNLWSLRSSDLRRLRRRIQIVFQNPFAALNPRLRVERLVAEPLQLRGVPADPSSVIEHLERVGLSRSHLGRYPHELSGGQCQRVALARALAIEPALIVLDEPTSALDVSVQAQVLNLLQDLREQTGVAYLLISHDLSVVRHVADRVGVLCRGRLVEEGATADVLETPQDVYTRQLLASVPGRGREALLASRDPTTDPHLTASAPPAPTEGVRP